MTASDGEETLPRVTIQQALAQTINDRVSSAEEYSILADVPKSTLSLFRNNRRGVQTTTLQRLLDALTPEQFHYFLQLLVEGHVQLEAVIERADRTTLDPLVLKDSFLALVASFCTRCSREEQLELLRVIHQASLKNPKLRD
jgi:hypothetical protein